MSHYLFQQHLVGLVHYPKSSHELFNTIKEWRFFKSWSTKSHKNFTSHTLHYMRCSQCEQMWNILPAETLRTQEWNTQHRLWHQTASSSFGTSVCFPKQSTKRKQPVATYHCQMIFTSSILSDFYKKTHLLSSHLLQHDNPSYFGQVDNIQSA